MRAMFALVKARQLLPRDPREHAVLRLQHGDMFAKLGQHRRRLQSDIAAADHHDALRGGEFGHQHIDIGARAHRMDASIIMPRTGQPARAATPGPDQMTIADRRLADRYGVRRRIDRRHALPEQHRHVALFPESGRADQQPLERLLPRQIILRQWRAFVRQFRLVADHRNASGEFRLAQRDRGLRAGMASADDHHIVSGHARQPFSLSACHLT